MPAKASKTAIVTDSPQPHTAAGAERPCARRVFRISRAPFGRGRVLPPEGHQLWVRRVAFSMSAVCPVYTQQQTFPDPVGTSHLCQMRTSGMRLPLSPDAGQRFRSNAGRGARRGRSRSCAMEASSRCCHDGNGFSHPDRSAPSGASIKRRSRVPESESLSGVPGSAVRSSSLLGSAISTG